MFLNDDTTSMALMVHAHKKTKKVVAVSHDVLKIKGGFTLGSGRLLCNDDKYNLIKILQDEASESGWIDDTVIYQAGKAIIWTTAAHSGDITVDKECITNVPYPRHVFVLRNDDFKVFSCKGNKRPDANTKLYYSPTLNTYSDGNVCLGNFNPLSGINKEARSHWERFIFEGNNTHLGDVQVIKSIEEMEDDLTTYKQFWKSLVGKSSFPSNDLMSCNLTVGDLVA